MVRRARPGLGTLVDIAVDAQSDVQASAALDAAFAGVESLEAQLSAHKPDSELNRLCGAAHQRSQRPGAALIEVLQTALDLHRQSRGIFDVVTARQALLKQQPSATSLAQGSSADIELHDNGSVSFRRPLRLDLGGLAKGYIIDRTVALLQARGIANGRVNAGGDLRVFGETVEPVSLRFADGFRVVAQLHDGAFAASRTGLRPMSLAAAAGDPAASNRHFDGRTGQAVDNPDTVAVFAERAIIADALTKLALVCPVTTDALCASYSAQWRRYPFHIAACSSEAQPFDVA